MITVANHRHFCWAHEHSGQSQTFLLSTWTQQPITDISVEHMNTAANHRHFKNPLSIQIAAGNAGIVSFYYILVTKSVLFDTYGCHSHSYFTLLLSGIFAFKCVRAEEIFNKLQDIMHNNSISVVEEPVLEPELPATPHTPTSKNTHTHTHTHSSAHAQTRGSHWPLHRSLCSSWLLCPDGSQWDRPLPFIRRRLLAAVQPSPFSGQHSVTVSRGGVHTPTAAQWRDGTQHTC